MRTLTASLPLVLLLACRAEPPKESATDADTASNVRDADGDGFDSAEGDCDDGDADTFPGAQELCDGVDQDCDGTIDEGVATTWYADADEDGFGDAATAVTVCEAPAGHVATANDCDDGRDDVYPLAAEACDGVDNDCDGELDDGMRRTVYEDADGDGFGDDATATESCALALGQVLVGMDCDDNNADAWPEHPEVCDEEDNDCDGTVDEDVTTRYWADLDGDGFGDDGAPLDACVRAEGYAAASGDCDDADATVNPAALEACDDPADRNCDGSVSYADLDGDGFAACLECDDTTSMVNPAAPERCNGVDDDCDGAVDDADTTLDLATASTWYADRDGDGFGDAATPLAACERPSGYVADATDCDDGGAGINPAAIETCNGVDDDCDGRVDDGALDAATWYADADGDGYGDAGVPLSACEPVDGTVADATDCDDTDAAALPGAVERLDGNDDDCDGIVDEAAVAVVFASYCLSSSGHESLTSVLATAQEESALRVYLAALALGMDRFDEPASGWTSAVGDLASYDLVVFNDCGWSWQPGQQAIVDALLAARAAGSATLMLGDDIGWGNGNVAGEEPLTLIGSAPGNGTDGLTVSLTGASHPALSSPAGTPTTFIYPMDIDQCSDWGGGEVVLARASNGSPAWSLYEDRATGARGGMIPMSIYMGNHRYVGASAEPNLAIQFKNSAWWLLGL